MLYSPLVSAAFFWSAFEQKPTSFNLFANDYTNRMIADFEIPAVWFQSIIALFIILLAPVFSWAWPKLASKHSSEQHHQVRDRYSVRGGFGLMMLAAQNVLSNGGAGFLQFGWWAGHPDADARGTVPESDWSGDHEPAGAGENARPDDGPVVLRQALGNLAAGLIGGHVKADQLDMLPDPCPLLHCAADLCCGADRPHCSGAPHAGKCAD